MAIITFGYTSNGKIWRQTADGTVIGTGKQMHSEIGVFNKLGNSGKKAPYLILQNAFPCEVCDQKFIDVSKKQNTPVVFKITANEGCYSAEHNLAMNYGTFPTYIWYLNGVKTLNTALIAKPATFPICPSIDI